MEGSASAELFSSFCRVAQEMGARAWIVGGTVRDKELGRPSPDIDAVVDRAAGNVAREVADRLRLPWFVLSAEYDSHRVVDGNGCLDVALLRGRTIEDDLRLRDFTVNAMAVPVEGGLPVDPVGGMSDLKARRLVAVSPEVFRDDPLRLLRAPRLISELGFSASSSLERLIRREAWRVPLAAAERRGDEVVRTLRVENPARSVRLWERLGVLETLFPEVAALRGLGQSDFHHHDAYGHTLEALERLDELLTAPDHWFGPAAGRLAARLAEPIDGRTTRRAGLSLAALLHDVGKPATRSVDGDGFVRFWGHTDDGADMAKEICGRLACSRAMTSLAACVAARHLAVGFLQHEHPVSEREVIQYLWDAAPWEPELILVSMADRLATRGSLTNERFVQEHVELSQLLMNRWAVREEEGVDRPPVRGDEVAADLGLEPGPFLGRVLSEVKMAWEAGEIADKKDALALACRYVEDARSEEGAS